MDLTNRNLHKKNKQLIELKRQSYEKVYSRCRKTIIMTSNAGELICIFEIPEFMFGCAFPIINQKCCANYIINKLTKENPTIKTMFIEPNILFIDWRINKKSKRTSKNKSQGSSTSRSVSQSIACT